MGVERPMRMAILLTAGQGRAEPKTVAGLVQAAVRKRWWVDLFLMDDGIYHADYFGDLARKLAEIEKGGVLRVALCAHNLMERGGEKREDVLFGSQADWAAMVDEAERVLVFG